MAAERTHGLIVGAAPWRDGRFLRPYLDGAAWTVFCADGGYANAVSAGLQPDFLIGDWDSGERPALDVPCVTLPAEKDVTDLQAAMDQALSMGITELLLCGCTGGRLDHTASNLLLLEWLAERGGSGMIVDEDNEVRLLCPGVYQVADLPRYHYLSLIPLDRKVTGVTLSYDALVDLWGKFEPYTLNTMLASPDVMLSLLKLDEMQSPMAGLNFAGSGDAGSPLGAKLIRTSALPEDTLIGLDRGYALEMVSSGGVSVEYDRLIDRQLERAAITSTAGFAKIYAGAAVVMETV